MKLLPSAALVLSLLLLSCKEKENAATTGSQPPAAQTDAGKGGTPAVPSAATATTSTAAPASKSPAPPAQPRAHHVLLALIDFSKFPAVDGASRQSASPVSVGFSMAMTNPAQLTQCASLMDKFLVSQGWQPAPAMGGDPWTDSGGTTLYTKAGATLSAGAGVSRGSGPGDKDINAGMFLLSDADARHLPRPPGSKETRASISSALYLSPMDLMGVRKFHKEQFLRLGWTEFRPHLPGGIQLPMAELEKTQSFVQNGAIISYRLTAKGPETEVSVQSELQEYALPIPAGADMVKLEDSPPFLSCSVDMTPEQVLVWCQDTLGKQGWTATPTAAKEPDTICHQLQRAGSKTLLLECLPSQGSTIMRLRETNE